MPSINTLMKNNMKETEYYKSGQHTKNALLARQKATEASAMNAKQRRSLAEKKYYLESKHCKRCNKVIDYNKRENTFCSSSCAAIVRNKTRGPIQRNKKHSVCSQCGIDCWIAANASSKTFCNTCRKEKHNRNAIKWRNSDSNKVRQVCKVCGQITLVKKGNKTCGSKDCKTEASVGCRAYPNFRKKLSWFFNPYQNKKVLLESSWELELAESLTNSNVEWIRPKFIKWIDLEGTTRRYFPDFYLPKYDIYLDPKNPYAMTLGNSEEKMLAISKKVNIIYGDLIMLKEEINKLQQGEGHLEGHLVRSQE